MLSRHGNKPARYDSYVIHYDFHFANCFNDCHCVFTDCETFKRTIPFVAATVILRLVTSNKRMIKYSPLSPPPSPIVYVSDNRLSLESTTIRIRSIVGETNFKISPLSAIFVEREAYKAARK